jgi:hypothetical protein
MECIIAGIPVYLFIGLLLLASIPERKKGWMIVFVWPYVVYTPEGRDWFNNKIGL